MDEQPEVDTSVSGIEHLDDPELWRPVIGNPTAEFDATVTMRNALEASVKTILEVARGETVSRLRFDASKYLVERILGKPIEGGGESPWDKMLAALRDDAPAAALRDDGTSAVGGPDIDEAFKARGE